MKELDQFFSKLAGRLRKEPALSDITYTALETIPGFKKDFVRFFHPKLDCDGDIEVFREFRLKAGGQPDFVLQRGNSWDLIIENKIWDDNYHFDEYGKSPLRDEAPTKLGLIAVIKVPPPPNSSWATRQWADFVDYFEHKDYGPYTEVFKAYLSYVRKVCNMAEFEKFKIYPESLPALTSFSKMIQRTLEASSTDLYKIKVREVHKWNFGDHWAGYFFDLITNGKEGEVCLTVWYGLDFNSDRGPATIAVALHENENDLEAFSRISENLPKSPAYEKRLEPEFTELRMPEAQFKAINNLASKEAQLSALKEFLKVCAETLVKVMHPQKL